MIYEFGKRKKKKKFLDTFLNILFLYLLKYSYILILYHFSEVHIFLFVKKDSLYFNLVKKFIFTKLFLKF